MSKIVRSVIRVENLPKGVNPDRWDVVRWRVESMLFELQESMESDTVDFTLRVRLSDFEIFPEHHEFRLDAFDHVL